MDLLQLQAPIPLLRIFDEAKVRAFCIDYLSFRVDWEYRFEPGFPLYLQVARDGCVLHLTEHHGDACPGAALRIATDDLAALQAELSARPYAYAYAYARPGIEATPWGSYDMGIKDPFGNRLVFTADSL